MMLRLTARFAALMPALIPATLLMGAPLAAQDAPAPAPAAAPAPVAEATAPAPAPRVVVGVLAPADIQGNAEWQLALDLSTGGRVVIQLRPDAAPQHVERIKTLARQGFYNGLTFHRVIDGFMAQGGDPLGNGSGGSPLPDLTAEFNDLPHVRGALSMARAESPNSANSQFFIMLLPRLALDRNYTVFGRVISGMEFVDRMERGEPPANPSRIVQASIVADGRPAPALAPPVMAPTAPAPVPAG